MLKFFVLRKEYRKLFFILWIGCVVGGLAVLPYLGQLGLVPLSGSIVFTAVLQSVILYGLVCWFGLLFLNKVDLDPFRRVDLLKGIIYPGVGVGVAFGLLLFALQKWVFHTTEVHPPFWAGILAAIYGGWNEEVLCRLFFLTFFYFLLTRLFKKQQERRANYILIAILLAAILFSVGHLVAAVNLGHTGFSELVRILTLNGVAGIAFGWLYCTQGFWTAALAHFVADLMILFL